MSESVVVKSAGMTEFLDSHPVVKSLALGGLLGASAGGVAGLYRDVRDAIEERKRQKNRENPGIDTDTIVLRIPRRKASGEGQEYKSAEISCDPMDHDTIRVDVASEHTISVGDDGKEITRDKHGRFVPGFVSSKKASDDTGAITRAMEILGGLGGVVGGYYIADGMVRKARKKRLKSQIEAAQNQYLDMLDGSAVKGAEAVNDIFCLGDGMEKKGFIDKIPLVGNMVGATKDISAGTISLWALSALASAYLTKKVMDRAFSDRHPEEPPKKINKIMFKPMDDEDRQRWQQVKPAEALGPVPRTRVMIKVSDDESVEVEPEVALAAIQIIKEGMEAESRLQKTADQPLYYAAPPGSPPGSVPGPPVPAPARPYAGTFSNGASAAAAPVGKKPAAQTAAPASGDGFNYANARVTGFDPNGFMNYYGEPDAVREARLKNYLSPNGAEGFDQGANDFFDYIKGKEGYRQWALDSLAHTRGLTSKQPELPGIMGNLGLISSSAGARDFGRSLASAPEGVWKDLHQQSVDRFKSMMYHDFSRNPIEWMKILGDPRNTNLVNSMASSTIDNMFSDGGRFSVLGKIPVFGDLAKAVTSHVVNNTGFGKRLGMNDFLQNRLGLSGDAASGVLGKFDFNPGGQGWQLKKQSAFVPAILDSVNLAANANSLTDKRNKELNEKLDRVLDALEVKRVSSKPKQSRVSVIAEGDDSLNYVFKNDKKIEGIISSLREKGLA